MQKQSPKILVKSDEFYEQKEAEKKIRVNDDNDNKSNNLQKPLIRIPKPQQPLATPFSLIFRDIQPNVIYNPCFQTQLRPIQGEYISQGFKPYQRKSEENPKQLAILEQNQRIQSQRILEFRSISARHKEKNYNKNFIKSIGAKIIIYIKETLHSYLKFKGIQDYQINFHYEYLDREKKVSVQFFKSLMHTLESDSEDIKQLKMINRSLGFRYLKQNAQKDIFRNNKVIKENQGAYLLHCKLLERKLSNPEELDYLC